MEKDKLVEELARAMFSRRAWNSGHSVWDDVQEFVHNDYRNMADGALARLADLGLVVVEKDSASSKEMAGE